MKINCVFLVTCFGLIGFISFAKGQSVVCPAVRTTSGWLDLFPLPCQKSTECRGVMGTKYLCCKGFCTKGVKPAAALRDKETQSSLEASSSTTSSTSTTSGTSAPSTSPSTTSTTTSTTTTTTTTPSTTTSTTTTAPSTTTSTTTPTTTTSSTTTTTTPRPKTALPTEPPQPYLQILPIRNTVDSDKKTTKNSKNQKVICPKPSQIPIVLFPIPCENTAQCISSSGPGQVCCQRQCVQGVPAPKPAAKPRTHQPLLGVIPRECPSAPLGELLFEVQTCKTDADCWPRICCQDGDKAYCRTAKARLDLVPIANQIDQPVRMLEQYLQCTAPPKYDAFPKQCTSSVDCFPNLCCAEGGKKHCRPPKRSLLALLAGVTQRVGSSIGNLRPAQGGKNL